MFDPQISHPFFKKDRSEQNIKTFQFVFVFLLFNVIMDLFFYFNGFWQLSFLLGYVSITILAPFVDVPSMVHSNKLVYQSKMLYLQEKKEDVYELHGGTLFDYFYCEIGQYRSSKRQKYIMLEYLKGLMNVLETFSQYPDKKKLKFVGSTYILSHSTADKFGFKTSKIDGLQFLILLLNYFNLLVGKSIANGVLKFPKLSKVISISATYEDLEAHQDYIKMWIQTLEEKI